MVFTGTSLLLGRECSKITNYQDLLSGQIDIYRNWGRVTAVALRKKSIAVSLCWPHFFLKFLFQAVYLEFCVGRVLAGNRWPTATENGGSLRKRLFTRTWAEFRETRRTVQFRGPRLEVIITPGPEGQGQGVVPGTQEAAAWKELPGGRYSPQKSKLHCRNQTPTEAELMVCPRKFVYLHRSFSEVFQFGR